MELVKLEDLPDKIRFRLDENFRKRIFDLAIKKTGSSGHLSNKLGCHPDTLFKLKFFIKQSTLKLLLDLTNITLKEAESNIIEIGSKTKDKIKISLPIHATPELASLVAHSMGDGCITNKHFSYFNLKRELIDDIILSIKVAFSTDTKPSEYEKYGGWEIEYPVNIGRLLLLVGAPLSKKVYNPFRVPKWIMKGSKEIKSSFLRALFDDEGWVKVKINKKTKTVRRMIGINMSKNVEFIQQHEKFFEDIRKLFSDLDIETSKVIKMGKTKNGISLGIIISNFDNLSNFLISVGFINNDKNIKLYSCLTSSKRFDLIEKINLSKEDNIY